MSRALAAMLVAAALIAAPALAVIAEPDHSCCASPSDPCETDDAPCTALVETPCCDAAPAVPASAAKRAPDAPAFQTSTVRLLAPAPSLAPLERVLAVLLPPSPSRLSVVLRI